MNVEIKNEYLSVKASSFGAELQSICGNNTELLWQGEENIWRKRSPLLFPIVGRLKNDELKYNGDVKILKKHGFAQEMEFELEESSTEEMTFVLHSNAETHISYPFDFKLSATYSLNENHLIVTYNVLNTGSGNMYFSIGGHPGFNCEPGDKLVFEKIEKADRLIMNENSYIASRCLFLDNSDEIEITESLFENDALIFDELKSEYVTLKTKNCDIKFTYSPAPYLGIWAKPAAPYVCIEPWFGVDDDIDADCTFDKKKGIVELESGKTFTYSYDIEVIQPEDNYSL